MGQNVLFERIRATCLDPNLLTPLYSRKKLASAKMIQAGSWPTLNPVVPQPWLLPIVMSLKPKVPLEYKRGFKKPRGDFLAWKRASFKRDTNPANAGDDAEVPPMRTGRPLYQIRKRSD